MTDFNDLFRGDSHELDVAIAKDGVPLNITGCTLRFTAKRDKSDPDLEAVISKVSTDSSEIEITDALNGEATIHLVPGDTAALTQVTTLYYDVQVTDGTGRVSTVVSGRIKFKLDVTVTTP